MAEARSFSFKAHEQSSIVPSSGCTFPSNLAGHPLIVEAQARSPSATLAWARMVYKSANSSRNQSPSHESRQPLQDATSISDLSISRSPASCVMLMSQLRESSGIIQPQKLIWAGQGLGIGIFVARRTFGGARRTFIGACRHTAQSTACNNRSEEGTRLFTSENPLKQSAQNRIRLHDQKRASNGTELCLQTAAFFCIRLPVNINLCVWVARPILQFCDAILSCPLTLTRVLHVIADSKPNLRCVIRMR